MKRPLLIAAWIAGSTVPLLVATVYLVGCCVLPFHGVIHKLMPLCQMAISFVHGDETTPATPAPEKEKPVKRIVSQSPQTIRIIAAHQKAQPVTASSPITYRSFITLGAVRCDQDVGLHVLVETFLI